VTRLGRFDADAVAKLFAETIDWDVPGATTVPWTGRRSKRHEVADYFMTLWSVCDTAHDRRRRNARRGVDRQDGPTFGRPPNPLRISRLRPYGWKSKYAKGSSLGTGSPDRRSCM
jgi:hypothetical protein